MSKKKNNKINLKKAEVMKFKMKIASSITTTNLNKYFLNVIFSKTLRNKTNQTRETKSSGETTYKREISSILDDTYPHWGTADSFYKVQV